MERVIQRVDLRLPKQPKLLQVCAYARVSTGKDAMLHSLSAQVAYYSQMIQNHIGWLYCGVYSDEAVTGTKQDREGLNRMLEECRKGNINMVITKSISRLSRNTVTLLQITRELKSLGIDVFFEEQNIHTLSAEGELMMTILASYAQEESRSASENQKWRIRKAFENGEIMNLRFLYGYDITAKEMVVNEKEAAVIREIFTRFNNGETMGAISRDLNERGYVGRFGGKWCPERVREILSNEKYIGDAMLQKRYRNNHIEKKLCRNKGELPKYYAEGTHDALVDKDVFEKSRDRLEILEAQAAERKQRITSVFSGLIHCGRCGNTYLRVTHRGRHYWQCTTYRTKGKNGCIAKKVPEEILKSLTCEALETQNPDIGSIRERVAEILIKENNTMVFCLRDGTKIEKQWEERSRSASWTPEMKEKARQYALQGWRNRK